MSQPTTLDRVAYLKPLDCPSQARLVLQDEFEDTLEGVKVTEFQSGVTVLLDVTLRTDKSREEDVDVARLSADTQTALRELQEEGGDTFDPEGGTCGDEAEILQPTTTPAPTGEWGTTRR